MDRTTMDLINATMEKIERYYVTFFLAADSKDSQVTKLAFYTAMLNIMREHPLENHHAQTNIINRLSASRDNALEILSDRAIEVLNF